MGGKDGATAGKDQQATGRLWPCLPLPLIPDDASHRRRREDGEIFRGS